MTFEEAKKKLLAINKIEEEYNKLKPEYDKIKEEYHNYDRHTEMPTDITGEAPYHAVDKTGRCYEISRWNVKKGSYWSVSWFIEEIIESIKRKHCYDCDCLNEGKCYGCDVYTIIGEIENDFVAGESKE